jgi:hypothetical protein
MKAILEFDLTDIDDKMDHMRCVKANDLANACADLAYLWKRAERISGNLNSPEYKQYKRRPFDWWTKQISDIMEQYNITEELTT